MNAKVLHYTYDRVHFYSNVCMHTYVNDWICMYFIIPFMHTEFCIWVREIVCANSNG